LQHPSTSKVGSVKTIAINLSMFKDEHFVFLEAPLRELRLIMCSLSFWWLCPDGKSLNRVLAILSKLTTVAPQ
jgi:hypothetical protein